MKKRIFTCIAMLGFVTVCLAIAHKRVEGIPQQELVRLPSSFKTAIEGINIVGINVVYDELNNPVLDVTIRNNTARNVTTIFLESITPTHSSGEGLGSPRENPMLPAFGSVTMKFKASSLLENAPLMVSVVVWDDGTTSGLPKPAEHIKEAIAKTAAQAEAANQAANKKAAKEKEGHQ
jgi:hypothetical protein